MQNWRNAHPHFLQAYPITPLPSLTRGMCSVLVPRPQPAHPQCLTPLRAKETNMWTHFTHIPLTFRQGCCLSPAHLIQSQPKLHSVCVRTDSLLVTETREPICFISQSFSRLWFSTHPCSPALFQQLCCLKASQLLELPIGGRALRASPSQIKARVFQVSFSKTEE